MLTPSEQAMWSRQKKSDSPTQNDPQINEKYKLGEHRIVTEANREKLPNFVKALEKPGYMQIKPFYQRRKRWDVERQSQLIESFIMNIPVPPLFLYERDFNRYEVMDGQQRITALQSFYAGEYKLKGLTVWRELNGRTYSTLPSHVRDGLDRRSISYMVVLRESTPDEEDATFLRQTVFERLNTGGIKLEHQEIRNCLYQGMFNDLLLKLSRLDIYRDAFNLPRFISEEDEATNQELKDNKPYKKMEDVENILRFFALRNVDNYSNGMHGFLDTYMLRSREFPPQDIAWLGKHFEDTIETVTAIYGDRAFKTYDPTTGRWSKRPHRTFYDAVMISISTLLNHRSKLIENRNLILEETKDLFALNEEGAFTGRANTKADIKDRIEKFAQMLRKSIDL